MLALRANRTASADELIDGLYAERPAAERRQERLIELDPPLGAGGRDSERAMSQEDVEVLRTGGCRGLTVRSLTHSCGRGN
jgi:hypothetical protein